MSPAAWCMISFALFLVNLDDVATHTSPLDLQFNHIVHAMVEY
jgi:hypothetical protein